MATAANDQIKDSSIVGKARAFAREHKWATATLGVVLAIASVNTLRGK
jgi:hypothetical protein